MIFSGVHVWTADTPTAEMRAAWIANLDKIAARKPAVVVAGHTTPDAATDLSGIAHTKAYLVAFEEELAKAKDGAALEGGHGSPLPQSRHGRRPRHRLQGRQRRNEVGLRRAPISI